jgi:hypothetical protein
MASLFRGGNTNRPVPARPGPFDLLPPARHGNYYLDDGASILKIASNKSEHRGEYIANPGNGYTFLMDGSEVAYFGTPGEALVAIRKARQAAEAT